MANLDETYMQLRARFQSMSILTDRERSNRTILDLPGVEGAYRDGVISESKENQERIADLKETIMEILQGLYEHGRTV